jgi:hypothetical protein
METFFMCYIVAATAQTVTALWLHPPGWHAAAPDWILRFILQVITPLLCLSLEFYAAHERPWDRRAWLLLLLLISYPLFVIGTDKINPVMSWPPVICSGLRYRSAFASGSRTDRARPAPMHAGGCASYSLVWQISFLPILFVDLLATRILKLKWSDFPVWILFWATLPLALFPVALA